MLDSSFFPPGPDAVPSDLTKPTRRYRLHAWGAMLAIIGFIALYFLLLGWFIRNAYRNIVSAVAGGDNGFLAFAVGGASAFFALFMIKGLFFVTRGDPSRDIELTADVEPQLFSFLHRLADEVGAPRPHRVFLAPGVNASVFYDLSLLNLIIPSRKNLSIGLGLVNALTLSEFKAVLAHEFGHFAQRSMAVGRWVYVGQRIARNIVVQRDWLDQILGFVSSFDLRVAWIGWILQFVVWSIRSLLDTAFGLVALAERALSREMEFQADLVSVSVTGSDALIHALHRAGGADSAWDAALSISVGEYCCGRRVQDAYAIQTNVSERVRHVLDDPHHDCPPPLPAENRAHHRLFKAGLAQAPRMWSTHPENHEREENAKRTYLAAKLDDRSAWELFQNPAATRMRMTNHLLDQLDEVQCQPATAQTTAIAIKKRFGGPSLERRYRGTYLGRVPVLDFEQPSDMYDAKISDTVTSEALDALYPESLHELVKEWRNLNEEHACLEALRDGLAIAPRKTIQYRDRTLKKDELPEVIASVEEERARSRAALRAHDIACRTLHLAAAAQLGKGWDAYLRSLAALLHYAAHTSADLADARGHMMNVLSVVTADGHVSSRETTRLVAAAYEVYSAIWFIYEKRSAVTLPPNIAVELETPSWAEALPEYLQLEPPDQDNIGQFLDVIDSWLEVTQGPLAQLVDVTLDALLEAEAHVSATLGDGAELDEAPPPAAVPVQYTTLTPGSERDRQRRLGLWDRFATADGFFPSLARLAVAGAVVGGVLGFTSSVGDPTVIIYNSLERDITVSVAGVKTDVWRHSKREIDVPADDALSIRTTTDTGELIEEFDADAGNGLMTYVYNVASASPLVEWTAIYGPATPRERELLGPVRWHDSRSDVRFQDPPDQVEAGSGGATRTVLSGYIGDPPEDALSSLQNAAQRSTVVQAHARWDLAGSPYIMEWLSRAAGEPWFHAVLASRLKADPKEVVSLRMEQDTATPAAKPAICARHRQMSQAAPDDGLLRYVAIRCVEDDAQRDREFESAYAKYPHNGWLAYATAGNYIDRGDWPGALSALSVTRKHLPARKAESALLSARLIRFHPPAGKTPGDLIPRLALESSELKWLASVEAGQDDNPRAEAYALLAQGKVSHALTVANAYPEFAPYILRLVGASDGVQPAIFERAVELKPDVGLNQNTIWAALGSAVRAGKPTVVLAKEANQLLGADLAKLAVRVATDETFRRDTDKVESALTKYRFGMRARVYAMVCVIDEQAAPRDWRRIARGALFSVERPFLAPSIK